MNFFFQHIEYLLLRHDCVIVPGLGAFIATMMPARIDFEKGVVLPPSRSLMFNQAVALDDGLLANSISRKTGLTFEESRQAIVRCVANIKETLNTVGEVEVASLGALVLGEEGNLLFAPRQIDFSSSEIGYESVKFGFSSSDKSVSHNSSHGDVEKNPEVIQEESGYYHFRINRNIVKLAVMITAIIAVALTVILNPLPSDVREQRASVVPVESIITAPAQKPEKQDTSSNQNFPADTKPAIENIPAHYLIVATFSNEAEAISYAKNNSTEEYPLTTVSSRKMTRVSVASSDHKDDLRRQLNTTEIRSRFPNAWIWSRI